MGPPGRRCDGKTKRIQISVDSSGKKNSIPIITRCAAQACIQVRMGQSCSFYCNQCYQDICEQLPAGAVVQELG